MARLAPRQELADFITSTMASAVGHGPVSEMLHVQGRGSASQGQWNGIRLPEETLHAVPQTPALWPYPFSPWQGDYEEVMQKALSGH